MTVPKYDASLIAAVADALANEDNEPGSLYESMAFVALETYRLWRENQAAEFVRLSQQLGLDKEDDGA